MNSRCDSCLVTNIYLLSATLMKQILLCSPIAQTMSFVGKEVDMFLYRMQLILMFSDLAIFYSKDENTSSSRKVYEQFINSIVEMITNKGDFDFWVKKLKSN